VVLVVLRLPSLSAVTAQCGKGFVCSIFSEVSDGEACPCELAFLVLIVGRGFGRYLERWLPARRRLLALWLSMAFEQKRLLAFQSVLTEHLGLLTNQ